MRTIHTTEKPDSLQPVMDVFNCPSLCKIIAKARFLLALDRHLQTILPELFRAQCHVMNVQEGVIVLGVANASIGTRLQFMSSTIMDDLKKTQEFSSLTGLKCKVNLDKATVRL